MDTHEILRLLRILVAVSLGDEHRQPSCLDVPIPGPPKIYAGDVALLQQLGLLGHAGQERRGDHERRYCLSQLGRVFLADISRLFAAAPAPHSLVLVPHWNADRRELWCGQVLAKRLRKAAPNQECILRAFELQGWPTRISDPLPADERVDSVERLHEAIKRLNAHMTVVRFGGDGTGRGVCWRKMIDDTQHV
jgi:hypothetical protein